MRALFVGDVFAKPGRRVLKNYLSEERQKQNIDVVIVNVENLAGGAGITLATVEELFQSGVDVMTSGNHAWDKKEDAQNAFKKYYYLLRPANYPYFEQSPTPGKGSVVFKKDNLKVGVINVQGRVFLQNIDCPFKSVEEEIAILKKETPIIFVDVHAETTAEKQALAWYVDGKVSGVFGTHTHVQTADERILQKGTAFISDAGMTGAYDSVIGSKKEQAIHKFLTGTKVRYEPAKDNVILCGVIVDVEDKTGTALSIKRVQWQSKQQLSN